VGDGTTTVVTSPKLSPTLVLASAGGAAITNIAEVAAGNLVTCVRTRDGGAKCWGNNYAGQVGDGTTTNRTVPTSVLTSAGGAPISGLAQIAMGPGADHVCALKSDSSVVCWGRNGSGQLGDGTTTPHYTPAAVRTAGGAALSGIVQVAVGNGTTCAVTSDARVLCWGDRVGNGSAVASATPTAPLTGAGGTEVTGVAEVGVGNGTACVRKIDGSVYCWGYVNADGMVGDPATTTPRLYPVQVRATPGGAALASAARIAVGANRHCAVLNNGSVVCWGRNSEGQVGDGTTTSPRLTATQVVTTSGAQLAEVRELAVGDNANWGGESACARRRDDSLYCWGVNTSAQIGDGTKTSPRPSATVVSLNTSCLGGGDGRSNCGPNGNEDCCASPLVTGGTFSRSYDGVTTGYTTSQYKATVSDFRLDKFEVTVGRFRQFVNAAIAGWRPATGAGKHAHLNTGNGLAASGGGYEAGWNTAWNTASNFPSTVAGWSAVGALGCNIAADRPTWTSSTGGNEGRPINCLNWYQAEAFCIWDGGFQASEAEWNYAAAGGAEQRVYPWGSTAPGTNANLAAYGCYFNGSGTCSGTMNIAPVGSIAAGAGKWGQLDLAGNVYEWDLDWYTTPYAETLCANCTYATSSTYRTFRGGSYNQPASQLVTSLRSGTVGAPNGIGDWLGARCARSP
jgi:formylglycine-generating enzyme required for sulfatase activity/alpha-tubulin suppressor-like RCC1 family protein